jgi:hypothetical protein
VWDEFPQEWEIANVSSVFKGKSKREELGNCRGILLLSMWSKIVSGNLAGR